jgi:hypothetical protein
MPSRVWSTPICFFFLSLVAPRLHHKLVVVADALLHLLMPLLHCSVAMVLTSMVLGSLLTCERALDLDASSYLLWGLLVCAYMSKLL